MSNIFAVLLMAAATAAAPPQAIALHAKRLLDVRSGDVAEAYIVVRGERIEAVAKSAPAGAKVIELGNATVLPGLIDAHCHLLMDFNDLSSVSFLRHSAGRRCSSASRTRTSTCTAASPRCATPARAIRRTVRSRCTRRLRHDRAWKHARRAHRERDGGARHLARADAELLLARRRDRSHARSGAADAREDQGNSEVHPRRVRGGD